MKLSLNIISVSLLFLFCTSYSVAKITEGAIEVDSYLVNDVETSVIDFSSKSSECANQVPRRYAKLNADGTLVCAVCGRNTFLESYNADARSSAISGTKHGPCCQNSHHRVCRAMLEEYKLRCEYENFVMRKAANFGGSWFGKGEDAGDSGCAELSV